MNCSKIVKCADNLVKTYETRDPFKIANYLGIEANYFAVEFLISDNEC